MTETTGTDQRLSTARVKEAFDAGVGCVVSLYPKCLVMLDDAVKAMALESALRVRDINEIMLAALSQERVQ